MEPRRTNDTVSLVFLLFLPTIDHDWTQAICCPSHHNYTVSRREQQRQKQSITRSPSADVSLNHPQIKAMNNIHRNQKGELYWNKTTPRSICGEWNLAKWKENEQELKNGMKKKKKTEEGKWRCQEVRQGSVWTALCASWPTVGRSGCWALATLNSTQTQRGIRGNLSTCLDNPPSATLRKASGPTLRLSVGLKC